MPEPNGIQLMIETKFKHTDIGLVPEEWEVKTLEEVSSFPTESILTSNIKTSEYVGTDNMVSDRGGILPFDNTLPYIRVRHYVNNDILTSNIRPYLKKIWLSNREGGCSSDVLVIRPKTNIVMPNFLFTVISSDNFFKYSNDNAKGTKMPRGDKHCILKYGIPIPPLSEQRRIASALMKVDALISNLDKLIQKKQAIKKGAMQELLTGKKRLPGFEGEWKVIRLGDVADIKTGSSNVQDADPSGSYPFFIRSEHVEKSNKYIFDSEAILIPGEGRIGEIFHYINGKFDCHQRVYAVSNFRWVNAVFVLFYMKYKFKEHALSQTAKATVDSLRLPTIKSFEMYIPTDISEQRAIAHVLSTMDSDISALETKRDKYRQIKQGMMRDLLTGRIRLVETSDMERKSYTVGLQNKPFDGAIAAEPSPQKGGTVG